MNTQKLSRPTDQRNAMLRGLVSDLLWYGKIETTADRAKSVARLAEKYITLAINSYEDIVTEEKKTVDSKGKEKIVKVSKDGPKKLNARRTLLANLYFRQEAMLKGEKPSAYKARIKGIENPLIEKIFDEIAPKYAARKNELGQGGGYTRVIKSGVRRGDNALTAIVELI